MKEWMWEVRCAIISEIVRYHNGLGSTDTDDGAFSFLNRKRLISDFLWEKQVCHDWARFPARTVGWLTRGCPCSEGQPWWHWDCSSSHSKGCLALSQAFPPQHWAASGLLASSNFQCTRELVRNAESQTFSTRICLVTNSQESCIPLTLE